MSKRIKVALLTGSVALVLCIFLGVNARGVRAASDDQQAGAYRQISVYGEVLQHVQSEYVEEPNIPAVTGGALRGMLESLDADSSYLSAADYKVFKADRGGKAQVGLNVSKRLGYATVVSVVPGSPADHANLSDGDIIEAVGKVDTRDASLAMIQMLLQGDAGTEVQLAVIRPRKATPEKVTLNRVIVSEPPVAEVLYENSTIFYLRPQILDKDHVQQIEAKLKGGRASGKRILLDLRDVSAGEPSEAVRLSNLFLKSGTIATLQGQKFPKETFTAEPNKAIVASEPLVVLVNRGTSGPAELVAGAIADNKRGDLVGEKTFGEGSKQKTFELPDGGAVILSIAKYASPSGKRFEDEAITPGVLVASNQDESPESDDAAAKPQTPAPSHRSAAPDDQLNKAIEVLKAKAA